MSTSSEDGSTACKLTFQGRSILVTGAASGIGASTARLLHERGARVALFDSDEMGLSIVTDQLEGAVGFAVDISRAADVNKALDEVVAEIGLLDGLAHAAGTDADQSIKDKVSEFRNRSPDAEPKGFDGLLGMSDAEWRRVMSVNLDGTFYCVRAALKKMIPKQSGSVVIVGSMAGASGPLGMSHYAASKAAVRVFAQSAAREMAGYGIRVNVIAPGPTDTAMLRRTPKASISRAGSIPLGRIGLPVEQAEAICFLLSDASSFITGETLNVNGGMLTT